MHQNFNHKTIQMKKLLPLLIIAILFLTGKTVISQSSSMVELTIIRNGEPITDTLDNGQIITFDTSSDDAEQENDEMDALFDDDLDAGWEGDPEDFNVLTTGLRFQNVTVPQGATIDSAYLILTSHEAKSPEDVAEITIVGEASDFANTYDLSSLITDRPETQAKLEWIVNEDWGLWTTHRTPDIKNIVQEIVNRNGWSYGNALAIMLKGKNQGPSEVENAREFESFENIADPEDGGDGQNHPERRPVLRIYYTVTSTVIERYILTNGDPITDTLDNGQIITFDTSSDDAEQENDEMDALFDDDLDAGWEGDPEDFNVLTTGLRFRDIDMPKNVTVDSAFIVVCSHEAKSTEDVAELTIVGEASDNAATYNLESLISDRPETAAKINWTVAEEWGLWTYHRTPDIKNIIQEIIDRTGWQTGNTIAIMIKGQNQGPSEVENAREFESFENIADPEDGGDGQNHPDRRPKLVIYYSSPSFTSETYTQTYQLDIYPNPVLDNQLQFNLPNNSQALIQIHDQSGRLLLENNTHGIKQVSLNIASLPRGIYIVKVLQDRKVYVQKMIK